MMRRPARAQASREAENSSTASVPAPVRGWNARESKAGMQSTDALDLINWFPGTSSVAVRKGCLDYSTGLPNTSHTLLPFTGQTSKKLFAAALTGIYDVTTGGAVGASVSAITSDKMQSINFNTLGGNYLLAVNAMDNLKLYDGAVWTNITGVSTPAITGLATTSISHLTVFKRRIWFTQVNSMSLWYLPVNVIGGALTEFQVGQLFLRGGYVVGAASWTIDGGIGIDDHFVVLSSEGEVAIYKGTDPSASTTWALVGVYFVGKPLGLNCFCKFGGDLLILCEIGLVPLSKILTGDSNAITTAVALSNRIDGAFAQAVQLFGSFSGWSVTFFPTYTALLVNIPTDNVGGSIQYAMNTITNAWAQFTGWNASAFIVFNSVLYFTYGSRVVKAWTGTSDFTNNIVAVARPAYSYFGTRARLKQFRLVRPILEIDKSITLETGFDIDFEDGSLYSVTASTSISGSVWDSGVWDSAIWGASSSVAKNWLTVEGKMGFAAALRLRISSKTATVKWTATDYVYRLGGIL